jgi:hypothetical protein
MVSARSMMNPPMTSLSSRYGPSVTVGWPSAPRRTVRAVREASSSAPPSAIFPSFCHLSIQA